jgi:hypothetical protein
MKNTPKTSRQIILSLKWRGVEGGYAELSKDIAVLKATPNKTEEEVMRKR